MDRKMSQDLDRHITGNYGEDQFKEDPYHKYKNHELNWKVGDIWTDKGGDKYILAMMNSVDQNFYYYQFINMQTGNRYSAFTLGRHSSVRNALTLSLGEVSMMIFERDISISTTDEDNVILDDLEKGHDYGPAWE
jgi:hypothetical protein